MNHSSLWLGFLGLLGLSIIACSASPVGGAFADGGPGGDGGSEVPEDAGGSADAGKPRRDAGSDAKAVDAAPEAAAPGCKFVDGESFVSGPTCSKIRQVSCDGVDYEIDCNCRLGTCSCVKNGTMYKTIDVASGTCSSVCQDVYAGDLLVEQAECGIE